MFERPWNGAYAFVAFGAVLVGIAIYLTWHASAQHQFYADEARYQTERAAERASANLQDCLAHQLGAEVLTCVERVVETKRDAKRAEYDLGAQLEMADWTRWGAIGSIIAAVAAVIGVVYVAGTLSEMQRTNEIAHTQLLAGSRPWLKLQVHVLTGLDYRRGTYQAHCRADVQNVGSSPAMGVRIHHKMTDPERNPQQELMEFSREMKAGYIPDDSLSRPLFPQERFDTIESIRKHRRDIPREPAYEGQNAFGMEFVVVATYRNGVDGQVHQTGGIFVLRSPHKHIGRLFFDNGQPTARGEIDIAYHPYGGFST